MSNTTAKRILNEKNLFSPKDLHVQILRDAASRKGIKGVENKSLDDLIHHVSTFFNPGFKIYIPEDGGDPELIPGPRRKRKHDEVAKGLSAKKQRTLYFPRQIQRTKSHEEARKRLTARLRMNARPPEKDRNAVAGPSNLLSAPNPDASAQGVAPKQSESHSASDEFEMRGCLKIWRPKGYFKDKEQNQELPSDGFIHEVIPYEARRGIQYTKVGDLSPPARPESDITEDKLLESYDRMLEIERFLRVIATEKEDYAEELLLEATAVITQFEKDVEEYTQLRIRLEKSIMGWKDGLPKMDTEASSVEIEDYDGANLARTAQPVREIPVIQSSF